MQEYCVPDNSDPIKPLFDMENMHCDKARLLRLWATMLCSVATLRRVVSLILMGQSSFRVTPPVSSMRTVSGIHCQIHNPWTSPSSISSQSEIILSKKYTSHLIYYVSKCSYGNNSFGAGSFELSTDSHIIEYSLKCGTSDVIMEPVSLFLSHYDTLSYDRKPINGLKE